MKKLKMKSREEIARINYLIGVTSREVGHGNERRVVAAYTTDCPKGSCPPWIKSVRLANQQEDRAGTDIVFEVSSDSRHDKVLLQVKSSKAGQGKFQSKQRDGRVDRRIVTAIIHPKYDFCMIRKIITPIISAEWRRMLLKD
ncbi:MAG: hypothetical protein A3B11_02180 [Candidatus Taylorbacteria bacterium RIFCSPLOWO2_01_FULL_44_26]|uniref:DUF4365 domain-containing protein n=2 Tax=Candidatus Tayloriibacteriota TaxID=1817919 RepID=A0A1G2MKT5_9BACT|nr:MAG: hypothetical protein A3D50_02305 [Candidatus Taylorbacteria bacterium RIFCSPHIGHO2_02_FULL_44_12]OHA30774.1 MAG: hypothetical protein A3B11_02180 [Candidatus Taylorbacteria bacterium RIFCSPLOWO2_01_FULL_44_26]